VAKKNGKGSVLFFQTGTERLVEKSREDGAGKLKNDRAACYPLCQRVRMRSAFT